MTRTLEETPGTDRRWLAGLYLIALLPRLAILAAQPNAIEPWEYETLAQNIVAGHGYVIPRFGSVALAFGDGNLYSFLAATVYLIAGHSVLLLAVIQAVLSAFAAPVIFDIGSRAFERRVAVLAAVLVALHPGLLAYTLKLHPLGLDVLLLALTVVWIGRAGQGLGNGLSAGLALGLNLMTRPTFFLAAALALVVRWRGAHPSLLSTIAAFAVALTIAAPWVARNWIVLGRPILISSSMEDVWKGNNPIASGSSYLPSGQDIFSASPPELQSRLQSVDELQLNDVFTSEVVAFVTQHPRDFAALTARKFVYFWWLSPQAGLLYPSAWLSGYEVYAAAVLVLAVVGAASITRNGGREERNLLLIVAIISLTVAVIHALSYVEGRHRWGVEPLLLLLTARGALVAVRATRVSRLYSRAEQTTTSSHLPR